MKVSFDGNNKIIQVLPGIENLIFETDVYVPWKQWAISNLNYLQAIEKVGGQVLIEDSLYISNAYILKNDWKIRPYDGQHILHIVRNVFSEDGSVIYVLPAGFDILVNVEIGFTGGLTPTQSQQMIDIESKVDEIWQLLGLNITKPVIVNSTSRVTDGITQVFQKDSNGNVIINRI